MREMVVVLLESCLERVVESLSLSQLHLDLVILLWKHFLEYVAKGLLFPFLD